MIFEPSTDRFLRVLFSCFFPSLSHAPPGNFMDLGTPLLGASAELSGTGVWGGSGGVAPQERK